MREERGDLFEDTTVDAICIPTNGFIKKNGALVMGKGVAKTARDSWPGLDFDLGALVADLGNVPHLLTRAREGAIQYGDFLLPYHVVSFPTKPTTSPMDYKLSDIVSYYQKDYTDYKWDEGIGNAVCPSIPGYKMKADSTVVKRSAIRLVEMADMFGWEDVALPLVGTGGGERPWHLTRIMLAEILDERFIAVKKA